MNHCSVKVIKVERSNIELYNKIVAALNNKSLWIHFLNQGLAVSTFQVVLVPTIVGGKYGAKCFRNNEFGLYIFRD